MKCPSKEIDKNNISLFLPDCSFSIVSLNLDIRYVCFFWLSCGVFAVRGGLMCLCWSKRGSLRNTPVCSQRSVLVLSCFARPRGCGVSLTPLRHWALTCTHTVNPLLRPNTLQAFFTRLFSEAWRSMNRERERVREREREGVLRGNRQWLAVASWIHSRSAGSTTTLLAQQWTRDLLPTHRAPCVNRGGSPQSSVRRGTMGELFSDASSRWWWWVLKRGSKNECRKYISVPRLTVAEH